MKLSSPSLRSSPVIVMVMPPANSGKSVALKVILTSLQTIRFRRILYSIFQGKQLQFVAWEIWCILTENLLVFKRVVLLYVNKCLK
jgi:hypothetical protein